MLQFVEILIYQTTYFLLGMQSLCFLCLFGKYHAKWRDIFLCALLIIIQCAILGLDYSYPNIPSSTTSNYICFALSIVTFIYMMRLLYLIAKAKNGKHSKKDFRYLSLIIVVLFVIMLAKMVYDFVF